LHYGFSLSIPVAKVEGPILLITCLSLPSCWIWNVKYYLVLESVFVSSNLLNAKQVIGIRDVIPPPLRREFTDVYIAMELMDTDLHQIIRSNQGLSEEHCQVMHFSF
jgi:hypothetical protein